MLLIVKNISAKAQTKNTGAVKTIPCDTLVCAAGVRPDDSLVNALRAEGIEAEAVGNCARLGRAIDAIADAAKLALAF